METSAVPNDGNIIRADPSKAFFIEMLTRDISLQECILDLVDNSIHNLIREVDLDVMQTLLGKTAAAEEVKAKIYISFSTKEFRIEDTCGGIPVEDAREHVFRFGNPRTEKGQQSGLGVYGIGMKRAFFKLGEVIAVESATDKEQFRVDIDVKEWEKKPNDWNLQFTSFGERKNGKKPGTTIIVRDLNPAVGEHLSLAAFQKELIRKLGATYALFLRTGLAIEVNENPVKAMLPELLSSGDLKPVRQLIKIGGVDVLILAGLSPRDDRDPHGWYVFCNGRMVLEADKSDITGWGENKFPQFHSKYNHFLGLVYFRSNDLRSLPWTTTKDGVEKESPIYQAALGQMRILAKPITEFLNKLYPQDRPVEETPEFDVLGTAQKVSLENLARSKNTSFVAKSTVPKGEEVVRISYTKPLKEVERVRKALGRSRAPFREIGEKTFDYFVRKECP